MDSRSLLGFSFLVAGLLLLLVLLVTGDLRHHFEVLELVDKESSHDSVSDLRGGEDTTVGSRNGSSGGVQSLEIVWSGNFNTLHVGAVGVLLDEMKDESSSYKDNKTTNELKF